MDTLNHKQQPLFQSELKEILKKAIKKDETVPGGIVYVIAPDAGIQTGTAYGKADSRSGYAMTLQHPVRYASNTKTFVAAAVLRLWENGRINLENPITSYISQTSCQILRQGGYEMDNISVLHLLLHTSGLFDYAESDPFDREILADPLRRWTREEQLEGTVRWGQPIDKPGHQFSYSDTNYILLGELLERETQRSLPEEIRHLLTFNELALFMQYLFSDRIFQQ